jgi:hypothetical protein
MDFKRQLYGSLAIAFFLLAFAPIASASALVMSKNYQLWDQSPDIVSLQQFLNADGFPIAQSGNGSPGHETSTFGPHTYRALKAFQVAHGLPATGFLGPLTRAAIASVSLGAPAPGLSSPAKGVIPQASATSSASYIPSVTPLPGYAPGQIILGGGGSAPDTTPPSVSLTAPNSGATVSGSSVTLSASASDNVAVANVQFKVDGANLGSAVTSSPYTMTWNSTAVADGSHIITAVARDAAGNTTISAGVSVTVRNTPPVISSIVANSISSTTETITWTTDEAASSTVNYGVTTSYGAASSSAVLMTSHSITLTGLTASTTYDYQVQSVDSQGNVATSSNQTFTTAAYTYYVDSVNGNDANPGTSPSLALKDITALPTVNAGQSVGLADGSHWRQQLTINAASVTVAGYGSGALPILDGSDIISNSSFTKTAGYTNVYNVATTTFIEGGQVAWVNMWETGGPSDSSTGTFLADETSISAVDSTACSYYIPTMTTSFMPSAEPMYVHSCDGTSPIANGYTYEFANRAAGLYMGAYGGKVSNIEARKSAYNDGAIELEGQGNSFTVSNVIARDGGKHVMLVGSGSTVSSSTLIDSYYGPTGSAGLFVAFDGTGQGLPVVLQNDIFQQDQNVPGAEYGVAAAIAHTASGSLGTIMVNGGYVIGLNGATISGFDFANNAGVAINNTVFDQSSDGVRAEASSNSGTTTVTGAQYVYTGSAGNNAFELSAGANMVLTNDNECSNGTGSVNYGLISLYQAATSTLTISGGASYTFSSGSHIGADNTATGVTLTVNNHIFDTAGGNTNAYTFYSTGNTFTGNNNVYTSHVDRWELNNVQYSTLAAWQAAVSPQDSAATTSGSGSSACTLPTIPTVN